LFLSRIEYFICAMGGFSERWEHAAITIMHKRGINKQATQYSALIELIEI